MIKLSTILNEIKPQMENHFEGWVERNKAELLKHADFHPSEGIFKKLMRCPVRPYQDNGFKNAAGISFEETQLVFSTNFVGENYDVFEFIGEAIIDRKIIYIYYG